MCLLGISTKQLYPPHTSPKFRNFASQEPFLLKTLMNLGRSATTIILSLSLFGHVARMPDNVPAKAVLRVACDVRDGVPPFPNWRRSRCRPPITWLHQICSDYVVCPLETPSTALRIGPRGERTLRPPRPCVDDDDDPQEAKIAGLKLRLKQGGMVTCRYRPRLGKSRERHACLMKVN